MKAFLIKLAVQLVLDKEKRKQLLIIILIPVLAVFLILCMLVYLITSPLGFLSRFFMSGEEYAAIRELKAVHADDIRIISQNLSWAGGRYPMPMVGVLTSEYGYRYHPVSGKYHLHTGIDIASGHQAYATAIAEGQVVKIGIDPESYGQYVLIRHDRQGDGVFYTFYAHLAEVMVLPDQEIFVGSVIGLEGGDPELDLLPGTSTGRHLHFEIRSSEAAYSHVDPYKWLFEPPYEEEDENSDIEKGKGINKDLNEDTMY